MKKTISILSAAVLGSTMAWGGMGICWTTLGWVVEKGGDADNGPGVAANGAVTWQLVYAGANGQIDEVDGSAANCLGGDDELVAVRMVPAGGGAAADGTSWDEWLMPQGGFATHEDSAWDKTGSVFQRVWQGVPGPGAAYAESGLFAIDTGYAGGGQPPQVFYFGEGNGRALDKAIPEPPRITGMTKTGDNLVLTFEGDGRAVYGTKSLSPQDWQPVEGATISGNSATVPMGPQRHVTVVPETGASGNSVGFVQRTVPAGGLQIVAIPYRNLGNGDGGYTFGETQVAQDLPQGSTVLFWDDGRQTWSGGAKGAKGWAGAQANRALGTGEAFFVKNETGEDLQVTVAGEVPAEGWRSRSYAGGNALSVMARPFPGEIMVGDTELANQVPQGTRVLFWDAGGQAWSGESKGAKGWGGGALRVVGEGEGFFVKSGDAGTWGEVRPYTNTTARVGGE